MSKQEHKQDHEKMDRMIDAIQASIPGKQWTEDDKQIAHNALNIFLQGMEDEDPNRMIPCNCHGEYWPSRDVDVWGLCPDGRASKAIIDAQKNK